MTSRWVVFGKSFGRRAARYRDTLLRGGNLYSDTLYTSMLVTAGRSFGFFVPFSIPILFGVTAETDIFFLAYSLILFVMHISADALRPVLGPYLAERSHDPRSESGFLSGLMARLSAYLLAFCAAGALVMKPLLTRFGFTPEAAGAARVLFLTGVPILFFASWGACLSAAINLRRHFWVTSLAPVLRATATLLIMFALHRRIGVAAVMIGFVAGEFAVFLFLWVMAKRVVGFRFGTEDAGNDVKSFLSSTSFYIACAAFLSINPVVDRSMASSQGVGSLTLLQCAGVLYFVVFSVVAVGFENVLSAYWSKAFHRADSRAGFRREALLMLGRVLIVSVSVSLLCSALRGPIVGLFFRWSHVTPQTVSAVKTLFGILIFALVPATLNIVLQNFFFIRRKTASLLAVYALQFVLNITFNWVFLGIFGLKGIALSAVLTNSVTAAILFAMFSRSRSL